MIKAQLEDHDISDLSYVTWRGEDVIARAHVTVLPGDPQAFVLPGFFFLF